MASCFVAMPTSNEIRLSNYDDCFRYLSMFMFIFEILSLASYFIRFGIGSFHYFLISFFIHLRAGSSSSLLPHLFFHTLVIDEKVLFIPRQCFISSEGASVEHLPDSR